MSPRRSSIARSVGILVLALSGPILGWSQITGSLPRIDLPDKDFYLAFGDYYKGDFSRAGRSFRQMSATSFKDANGLFLDSICYWTMQAECHYQLGEYPQAVELHEQTLKLYLDFLGWRDRTQFPPQIQAANNAWQQAGVTWGTPTRSAQFANIPNTFSFLFGRPDNDRVIREGGVVELPNMRAVDLAYVLRCTATSMYRRRQLKGLLCSRDPLTNKLIASLSTVTGGGEDLYSVWNAVLLGIAQNSAGKPEQALATLDNALQFNGGMDHTLTSFALLEMGHAASALGNYGDATKLYLEASYVAAVYEQYDLIGEALVGANQCHLRSRPTEVFPPLVNAIRWADREGADGLQATLLVELLKNQSELGLTDEANTTLGLIRRAVASSDLDKTALRVPIDFSSAVFQFQSGDVKSGNSDLANALQGWRQFSTRLYQIQFVDQALSARRVAPREADLMYTELLRDPTEADWLRDPCDAICLLMTDYTASLQMWYDVLVLERRLEAAFGAADQIRRHRFYSGLPLGGRLLTLRWMMEAPQDLLAEKSLQQRNDWIQRFPAYAQVSRDAAATLAQLRELPLVCEPETDQAKQQREFFEKLAKLATTQEQVLTGIALRREPAELAFAQPLAISSSEPLLPPKTMLLSFMETEQGVSVISVAERVIALEATVNKRDLTKAVGDLLRAIGNGHERNAVELSELKDDAWQTAATSLHKLLLPNRQTPYWTQFDEIIIVPDGVLWYAPMELVLAEPTPTKPLRIRYCPMVAMAIPNLLPPVQFPKTLLVGRRSTDKKLQTRFDEQLALLKAALPNVESMTSVGRTPTSLLSAVTDRWIAWTDDWKSAAENIGSFSWIPDTNAKPGHLLVDWQLLPWAGPRQLIVPQFSTDAGNGLRTNDANGKDLFLLSSHAIAGGAQTFLISRWNVGNSSSYQASTEFAVASGEGSAIDAWQHTVEKIKQLPVDVGEPSRIIAPKAGLGDRKSNHPFFWAGYMLVDTGWKPPAVEATAADQ